MSTASKRIRELESFIEAIGHADDCPAHEGGECEAVVCGYAALGIGSAAADTGAPGSAALIEMLGDALTDVFTAAVDDDSERTSLTTYMSPRLLRVVDDAVVAVQRHRSALAASQPSAAHEEAPRG